MDDAYNSPDLRAVWDALTDSDWQIRMQALERLDDGAKYHLNTGADEQPVYEITTISQPAADALEKSDTPEAHTALEAWRKNRH